MPGQQPRPGVRGPLRCAQAQPHGPRTRPPRHPASAVGARHWAAGIPWSRTSREQPTQVPACRPASQLRGHCPSPPQGPWQSHIPYGPPQVPCCPLPRHRNGLVTTGETSRALSAGFPQAGSPRPSGLGPPAGPPSTPSISRILLCRPRAGPPQLPGSSRAFLASLLGLPCLESLSQTRLLLRVKPCSSK